MEKILTFIINEKNELLLLQGSDSDPQFQKSFWYVVTGGKEDNDNTLEDTVKREVKEETTLVVDELLYLNWNFKYNSLGKSCKEYVYISKVKKARIKLNEESISYKWLKLNAFLDQIDWFYDKDNLEKVLSSAVDFKLYFDCEKSE